MKNTLLCHLFFCLLFFSCYKDDESGLLQEFMKFKADGEKKSFGPGNALSGGQFACEFLGDSALFIAVKYGVESIAFYIKSQNITTGTFSLNHQYSGFYTSPKDFKGYKTNNSNTGTITVKKTIYQSPSSNLPVLEGEFSFKAIDTTTGKVIDITDGQFVMRSFQY